VVWRVAAALSPWFLPLPLPFGELSLARTYLFRSGSGWAPLGLTRGAFPLWNRTPTAHHSRQ